MYSSPYFTPIHIKGRNLSPEGVGGCGCLENTRAHADRLPLGGQTFQGIPFDCGESFIYVNEGSLNLNFEPVSANFLVFLHSSETPAAAPGEDGVIKNFRGDPQLMETICEYVIRYADGTSGQVPIRTRMEINDMRIGWGQGAFLAIPHIRGESYPTATDDIHAGRKPERAWGESQNRVSSDGAWPLEQWLYAFENPHPEKLICGLDIAKKNGNVFLFGVTAAEVAAHPLRYGRRQKALLTLKGDPKDLFSLVDIDLGHIISVTPQPLYDDGSWGGVVYKSGAGGAPGSSEPAEPRSDGGGDGVAAGAEKLECAKDRYIVEFNAHEDAILYLGEGRTPISVKDIPGAPLADKDISGAPPSASISIKINPAERPVALKVLDAAGRPVPVKIHAHGAAGEYLAPRNRHRLPNPYWFEDYSVDHTDGAHWSAYIDGRAEYLLPLGEVFFEVSKGFEIKPQRRRFVVGPDTDELVIRLERVIDWRSKGWVTADTHVHFLSPQTALLEGEAEGVNVVNLLASQWGELFTNVGDFTGAGEAVNGDYIVRVGTENRQHVMGHISLLGYDGDMILPLTTGGPDESAQGDPMETTLTQWAERCRAQKGLNILPHFPNPRAENAAAIVSELIDGVEVTPNWDANGINPYYLSDWYRYLNCGYRVAAVGGTDKMSAGMAVGKMRTYAKLDGPLTYQTWKEAVIAGRTFATSGALIDMRVEGRGMGGELNLPGAAKLSVEWDAASVTIPITSIELVMNGETVDGARFDGLLGEKSGAFSVDAKDSAWLALRVRGRTPGGPEIITAHTSAVFVTVADKPLFNGPDAATILDQIEGVTAYVTTLATKATESRFKLALAALSGAHRALHNRMHAAGQFHTHNVMEQHAGH